MQPSLRGTWRGEPPPHGTLVSIRLGLLNVCRAESSSLSHGLYMAGCKCTEREADGVWVSPFCLQTFIYFHCGVSVLLESPRPHPLVHLQYVSSFLPGRGRAALWLCWVREGLCCLAGPLYSRDLAVLSTALHPCFQIPKALWGSAGDINSLPAGFPHCGFQVLGPLV